MLLGGAAGAAVADRVGSGAFAAVTLVQRGGQTLALKTYDPRGDPAALRHMQNEVALAGRLRHPNIIAPGAVRRGSDGRVELEMEYAGGGSLSDYVKRAKYSSREPLPEREASALVYGLVEAVRYLHAHDVCHHDIKLNNAMLDGRHAVRLIDFGTARVEAHCADPPVDGTLAYMAPEALAGGQRDGKASDVWALGVVFVNIVARGDFPFAGRDEEALRHDIAKGPPRLPSHLSASCRGLIEGMLRKDPAARMVIDEVARHPWVSAAYAEGVDRRDPMVAVDMSRLLAHLHVGGGGGAAVAGGAAPGPPQGGAGRPSCGFRGR